MDNNVTISSQDHQAWTETNQRDQEKYTFIGVPLSVLSDLASITEY